MPKVREETEEIEVCPECGSHHLVRDYERGELLCEDCGLVLDDQFIDQGPEWRAFDVEQGEKRARTGAPMTYTIRSPGRTRTATARASPPGTGPSCTG